MSAFKEFAERTAAALRTLATGTTKAPAAPVADAPAAREIFSGKFLKAIGAKPEANLFRIWVRAADGEFFSKPATAAEALQYANRASTWHRIA